MKLSGYPPSINEHFIKHLTLGKHISSVDFTHNKIDIHFKRGTHLVIFDEDTIKLFNMGWHIAWLTNNNDSSTRLKNMQSVIMLKRNIDVKI